MPTRPLAPVLHYLRRIEAEAYEHRDTDRDLLARFVQRGDEAAFAALLKRHGPLVYGVCRRVLRDRHAAEDAFQATFLLLVAQGGIAAPARIARQLAARRRLSHRAEGARPRCAHAAGPLTGDVPAPASDDALSRDLRPVLDRAIDDLPVKYRVPFVLCHLEGLTNRQAADQIGCPEGTVATRLSCARQRLRSRLARHGLGVGAGAAALGIGAGTLSAAPPSLLIVSTLRIATTFRLGVSTAVPATVAALTEGVCKAMLMTQIRLVLAAVALCATLAGGAALWAFGGQDPQPSPPVSVPPVQAPRAQAPPRPTTIPWDPGVISADDKSAVVRTDNFIVHAPRRRIAQLVGDAAERLRKSEAIRWLGKELPAWSQPCTLNVTLAKGGRVSGATTFTFPGASGKGVLDRDMTLEGTLDSMLCSGLPHEITHTVLADHFRTQVPRWADEGAALQAEDVEEQQRYRGLMREYAQPSRFIPLKKLLSMKNYPAQVMALYAEGYSLTHFLLERKDRKTFLAFVKQGMRGNDWDAAVKDQYGFDDVDALQQAWLATVGKPPAASDAAGIVADVIVGGNRTISTERILREIQTCAGLPYSAERAEDDAKRLTATHLFKSVAVRTQTADGRVIVFFQVWEHAGAGAPGGITEIAVQAPATFGRAAFDARGRLVLHTPVSHYKQVTRYVVREPGDTAIPVTSYELRIVEQVANYDPKDVAATDLAGKPIDAKTLAKRLQKETAVLIAPAGQTVDPYYLAIVREGTIILSPHRVAAPPSAPVAPPFPVPTTVPAAPPTPRP